MLKDHAADVTKLLESSPSIALKAGIRISHYTGSQYEELRPKFSKNFS